ncbi:hypothetical protein VFC49_08675 [Thermococcus sp. SY098]|uniref:hypothetical protein n=1 Tax=Thermococcus sp. SY098 TaxID=3111325 RepID=UPI002D79763C|nr:hypothetical protein [Thermococcus sp. SY098]WRS52124.1 hypothetical protein VFC49_08675 [Thermococcus sp. SY098]
MKKTKLWSGTHIIFLFLNDSYDIRGERMGTNVKLNIPEDVLKTVGIERVIKMIEREVMIEYSVKKLHGKFRGKNLRKLLEF